MASDISKFLELVNEGRVSTIAEEQSDSILLNTLPDEDIVWIGQVDTDLFMFGRAGGKYGAYGVLMGISPYRVVFYLEGGVLKTSYHSRSYWFDVDFEGEIWERGAFRKKEYTSLGLAVPKYKKGFTSSSIVLSNNAERKNGKVDRTFETNVSSLKWLNRETKKFESRKAQVLFDQLMEMYKNRRPATAKELMILVVDPEALEESFYATEAAKGQAMRVVAHQSPEDQTVVSETLPKREDIVHTCPECGHKISATTIFCGGCGMRLQTQDDVEVGKDAESKKGDKVELKDRPSVKEVALEDESYAKTPEEGDESKGQDRICGSCGAEIQRNWKRCPHCGSHLPLLCPDCGKPIDEAWEVCAFCGVSLPA
jgi:hypothetical protein